MHRQVPSTHFERPPSEQTELPDGTPSFVLGASHRSYKHQYTNQQSQLHIGLSWAEGLGKYKLTKVITLTPRFIIQNKLPDPICFREHGIAPQQRFVVKPGEKHPLLSISHEEEKLITFAYPGLNAQW